MAPKTKPKRARKKHKFFAWRDYRGMTQAQVAERMHINESTYGRIESGKSPYSQDHLEMAMEIFRCTEWDLLNRDPREDDLRTVVIADIYAVEDRAVEKIAAYVKGIKDSGL